MDPNSRRLLDTARRWRFLGPPRPQPVRPGVGPGELLGVTPADMRFGFVTRVLQHMERQGRPELNGQVVRVHPSSYDEDDGTYRVRAGGEVLRLPPANLRPAMYADVRQRVEDRGTPPECSSG